MNLALWSTESARQECAVPPHHVYDAGFAADVFEGIQDLAVDRDSIPWDLRIIDSEWPDGESAVQMHARSNAQSHLANPCVALQPI